jgi:hypothetical protein
MFILPQLIFPTIHHEHERFETFQHKIAKVVAKELHSSTNDISVERWRAFQTAAGFCFEEIWDSFIAVSQGPQTSGFLGGPCFLIHGGFREYNILVEVRDSQNVEITGIMDWDEAIIV